MEKNHFNICVPSVSSRVSLFLGWIELAKTTKKKKNYPGWFVPHRLKSYITEWPMWHSHQANTSTLDVEQIRKCVSWAGGRMVGFWVTVSPWTSHVLYPMDWSPPGSSVPGKNTGDSCHSLFQGIFLTQGPNPSLLYLLHCKWILYCWATREAHWILYWKWKAGWLDIEWP